MIKQDYSIVLGGTVEIPNVLGGTVEPSDKRENQVAVAEVKFSTIESAGDAIEAATLARGRMENNLLFGLKYQLTHLDIKPSNED